MAKKVVKKVAKKKVVKKVDTMKVVVEAKQTTIIIEPAAVFRTLERRTRDGWETMYNVSHQGARMVIDKKTAKFRKNPIFEVRLKVGKETLRKDQKRTEDQKLVEYTKVLQTERV